MRSLAALSAFVLASGVVPLAAQPAPLVLPAVAPSVDQILSLERVASPQISPDGRLVAYTVRKTHWDENAYETQIWLADARTGTLRQLTSSKRSSLDPAWSPDGRLLAFISDRTDTRQIYVINPGMGEAQPLTDTKEGVERFAWSPDAKTIAFTAAEPRPEAIRERDSKYGEFEVVGEDYGLAHLFLVDVATHAVRQLTKNASYTIGRFSWSPDGRSIAFDHRVNTSPGSSGTSDISIVSVPDGAERTLVTQPGPDSNPVWSPDGSRVAFETAMASPSFYFTNGYIATVPATGGPIQVMTRSFDEDPSLVAWKPSGVFFWAASRTWAYLYRVDPASGVIVRFAPATQWIGSSFSLSADGASAAFLGADARSMAEVYAAPLRALEAGAAAPLASIKRLTDMNAQTVGWTTGTRAIVTWKSQDGTSIEGVLHRPPHVQPGRKYPLLVVIHGGPTGVSRPVPFASSIYPIDVWVPRGVMVLEPNYRGSAGYGEKFRSLNVRNLGIGDAWDVLSGIDSLVAQGLVDPARVGVMGWSQGGYISAFLATHDSQRFKAVSVGAGISDWTTYYVNTDIHPFTRQYLKATPWDDPAIYARTSPITYIKQAKAPVLIQHGAADRRVPLPDAFELYQGLKDEHVPAKLIVYKGFGGVGHGPTRPKSHRATMEHNLEWFDEYLFNAAARPSSGKR
ncbi:MAG: prolyl oligopeptidase family serine peptidase [Betaproteobacteria bacterium]